MEWWIEEDKWSLSPASSMTQMSQSFVDTINVSNSYDMNVGRLFVGCCFMP